MSATATLTEVRQLTVMVKGQPIEFTSRFTNDEALNLLRNETDSFAQDLVRKAWSGLSDRQWAWVHKLAVDASVPKPEAVALANVSGIVALFDHAGSHLKHPKLHLLTRSGFTLRLSVAGPMSRFPRSVNVSSDAPYGQNTWYGRITREGKFEPSRLCTPEVTEYLVEFATDPARIAAEDGKRSGRCCFCGTSLTDERSLSVGYGPICADHWHLPWGTKS
jgi:hypothetical protein